MARKQRPPQLTVEDAVSILKKFQDDPVWFFREILGCQTVWPKMAEMLHSVRDNRRTAVLGCNSCVAPETRVFNALLGETLPIAEMESMPVWSKDGMIALSDKPFKKGIADLYKVRLDNGCAVICTLDHKIWTSTGWVAVRNLSVGSIVAVRSGASSQSSQGDDVSPAILDECGLRCRQKAQGSQGHYLMGYYPYGAQPLGGQGGDPGLSPLSNDALEHNRLNWQKGEMAYSCKRSRPDRLCAPLSSNALALEQAPFWGGGEYLNEALSCEHVILLTQVAPIATPSHVASAPAEKVPTACHSVMCVPFCSAPHEAKTLYSLQSSYNNYNPTWAKVSSIRFERHGEYYDMNVPITHNYLAEGMFHHNSGKDFTAGRLVLWWMCSRQPAKVVILGPTARQVHDIVWRETRQAYYQAETLGHPLGGNMLPREPRWEIDTDQYAIGFSTETPDAIRGFKPPNLLVIITESHGYRQEYFDAAKTLQPDRLFITGNPFTISGELFDAFHENPGGYNTINISAFDTPNLIQGRTVIPGMVTKEDVEERRKEWGEDNPLYIASVLGQFPTNLGGEGVPLQFVQQALEANMEPGNPTILAVDVAGRGSARTVACLRRGPVARIIWKETYTDDVMQLVGWIDRYLDDHKVDYLIVDGLGVGQGVVARLRELGRTVLEFIAGHDAYDKSRYMNRGSEVWWLMRQAFEKGQIDIENDTALKGQLVGRGYRIQSDRRILMEPKNKNANYDEADALSMTFAVPQTETVINFGAVKSGASERVPIIGSNPFGSMRHRTRF